MSLNKQCFLYSVATDAFYEEEERKLHKKLLKLYGLRKNIKDSKLMAKAPVENDVDFWKKTINILIDVEKKHLTEILDNRLKDRTPRELNGEAIKDRAIISLFESSLTRALGINTNELTKDLIVLNVFFFQVFESLVRDGFIFEENKYIFLTASAGQIRTKRAVFIREDKYNAIQKKIMCGLTVEEINDKGGMNPNKFLAYLALCNSATDVWEDFDIDRSIVVDDFETDVLGEVDHIDSVTYEIHRKETSTSIPHTDGCGMMLDDTTRMVRLPWVKGLLVTFPFDKFIEENTFKLLDFKTLGTYAHLIEDKIWFEKFVGRYIKWHNEDLGLVTNLKTGKVYDFDIFSKEIYSDYISVSQKVISKYNLDMNKLSKQIKENLNDEVLISCFDKYLNYINNKNVSNKRYFLTDEDLDNYISMSTKEVIKRINELR